jgi:hypothetical protein
MEPTYIPADNYVQKGQRHKAKPSPLVHLIAPGRGRVCAFRSIVCTSRTGLLPFNDLANLLGVLRFQ